MNLILKDVIHPRECDVIETFEYLPLKKKMNPILLFRIDDLFEGKLVALDARIVYEIDGPKTAFSQ